MNEKRRTSGYMPLDLLILEGMVCDIMPKIGQCNRSSNTVSANLFRKFIQTHI